MRGERSGGGGVKKRAAEKVLREAGAGRRHGSGEGRGLRMQMA